MIFVFVTDLMDRPIGRGLGIVVNAEPRRQTGPRGGVVGESGEGARLHRRRRYEIRRHVGSACAGAREHAEQRWPVVRQAT